MKVRKISTPMTRELEAQRIALETARSGLARAVSSLIGGPDIYAVASPRRCDAPASSAQPRSRQGEGFSPHALLAGVLSGAGGVLAEVCGELSEEEAGRLREQRESERRIDFYEDSMAELQGELEVRDYHRYRRFEEGRRMDNRELDDQAWADAEYAARQAEIEAEERRYADALALANDEAARRAYNLEAARQREADDYYDRMRR